MNDLATFPLRLPRNIKEDVVRVAKQNNTSANHFIAIAVAEKLATINAREYFERCAKGVDTQRLLAFLNRPGTPPPRSDDAISPELAKRMAKKGML